MSVARRPYRSTSPPGASPGRRPGTPGSTGAASSRGCGMPSWTLMNSGYAMLSRASHHDHADLAQDVWPAPASGNAGEPMLEVVKSSQPGHATDDDGAGLGERGESPVRLPAAARAGDGWAAAAGIVAAGGGVAAGELLAGFASPSLS